MTAGQPLLSEGMSHIITKEHRVQSGFANTDLGHEPKDQKIVIVELVANICIESTGRFEIEIAIASL